METIEAALRSGGPEDLKEALRSASSRVTVNRTRMAVQVTGCSGEIFAHFPIPEEFLDGMLD